MDPVLSRNGYLVLRRVALAKPGAGVPTAVNYCVCNPATGSCFFLPPYHVDQDNGFWEYSCALLTDRDLKHPASASPGSFELVVAAIPTERQELLVSVFSSRTMQWSSVRSVEIPMYNRAWTYLEMHPRPPPAVVHGVVCWQCTGDCTEQVMLALDSGGARIKNL
jgi:hypothetical protein